MKRLPDNLLYPKFLFPERMMPLREWGDITMPFSQCQDIDVATQCLSESVLLISVRK